MVKPSVGQNNYTKPEYKTIKLVDSDFMYMLIAEKGAKLPLYFACQETTHVVLGSHSLYLLGNYYVLS